MWIPNEFGTASNCNTYPEFCKTNSESTGRYTTDEQLEWLKSLTNRTNVLYVIYNLERSGRLVNNWHYVYSALVSDVPFQKSRARLYIIHVLAGPYELFPFRNTSGQLVRRGRDLHFPRYHVEEQEERKAFVAAVKYLLERVPLDVDLDALLSRWRWFAEGSVGCIGIVKTWLVDAVAATLAQGGTSLTEDMLTRTMLHPAKRVSLEMEARAGEHQVESNNIESAKQLQVLLGKPGKAGNREAPLPVGSMPGQEHVTKTEQAPENTVPPLSLPQVSPKPTKTHVGERAPSRDPVGETRQEEKSAKCSFGGVIDLAPDAFTQAGVSKVECPDCGAMRTVRVQRNTVTFPSHAKRLTSTPRAGERWIRRATVWELSERNV